MGSGAPGPDSIPRDKKSIISAQGLFIHPTYGNAFLATFITAGFLGFMDWKISVVSSNFIALLLILTISLTVHLLVKINEIKK